MDLQTSYRVYSRYYRKIGPFLKNPRVRAYTILILSLLTMSFFGMFAIKPTLKTIAHLKREIDDSQLVNEALEQKIISISQIKEEYKKFENDFPFVTEAMPSEPKFSFFLKDLETLAQEVGATISGINLSSVDLTLKNNQSPIKISSSLILSGNYSSCRDFLARLLNSRRIYTVDTFRINSDSKVEDTIKLDLKINTYYFQPLEGKNLSLDSKVLSKL